MTPRTMDNHYAVGRGKCSLPIGKYRQRKWSFSDVPIVSLSVRRPKIQLSPLRVGVQYRLRLRLVRIKGLAHRSLLLLDMVERIFHGRLRGYRSRNFVVKEIHLSFEPDWEQPALVSTQVIDPGS